MRLFISTGEVSGDLQGALLVSSLFKVAQAQGIPLEITALGGERMAAAGATLLGDTTRIGSVGLVESIPYLWPTWQLQRRVKRCLQATPPDGAVLIDYMGPNISLGSYLAHAQPQLPVTYYIAPQNWVWTFSERSTRQIVNISKRILAIFPQEADYYRRFGADVVWLGHPMRDRLENANDRQTARTELGIPAEAKIVTLLPASRRQELKTLLPLLLDSARRIHKQLPEIEFLIPLSMAAFRQPIEHAIRDYPLPIRILEDQTLNAIAAADLALTKSGTANLEIALLDVPQVVVYRVNPVTAWIMSKLLGFNIPFMSPANLLLMEPIVPELLQGQATPKRITAEALSLLTDPQRKAQTYADYYRMRSQLGEPGVSDRAATEIIQLSLSHAVDR
ncbi:MAG: lipid-A-disaccharide synthase [Cyanobacteria bacterium P01_H01_bin.15]